MKNAHPFSIGDAKKLLTRAKGKGLAGWGLLSRRCPKSETLGSSHVLHGLGPPEPSA